MVIPALSGKAKIGSRLLFMQIISVIIGINVKEANIDEPLYLYYNQIEKDQPIEEVFHKRLLDAYNYYLIIGGLPECVASWARYKDPQRIRQIQNELITIYENDFAKHNGKVNSGRILMVFRSIVSQQILY